MCIFTKFNDEMQMFVFCMSISHILLKITKIFENQISFQSSKIVLRGPKFHQKRNFR
uniref:Uncharacterized protein n=1 Tax=Meloidogyne enterolobii TaxID=390850 RepID=A0A6V7UZL3_MELEN|nr:unnamed protein product [Meloidogyne enterolobii]